MCHAEFCIGLGLRVLRHAYSAYAQHLWSTGLKMLVLTFVQMMCGQPKVCGTSAKGRRIGGKVWSWDRSALRRASSATGLWSCIMWEQGGMKFQVASMMRLCRYLFRVTRKHLYILARKITRDSRAPSQVIFCVLLSMEGFENPHGFVDLPMVFSFPACPSFTYRKRMPC